MAATMSDQMSCYSVTLGVFLLLLPATLTLHVEVRVPIYKVRGSSANLTCNYNLQGAVLYSLKWYKGDEQFFQYIPANEEPISTFGVHGIEINKKNSDMRTVQLQRLEVPSSGSYKCEVITEGPMFITEFAHGNMTVIDLPERPPVLEGARHSYKPGEEVLVNCTSPLSKPAASLDWYINEELAHPKWLQHYPILYEPDGLETIVLGLRFNTSHKHFPEDEIQLKCVAKIATIYFQSQETSFLETSSFRKTHAKESKGPNKRFLHGGATSSFAPRETDYVVMSCTFLLVIFFT
ncbi:cell adhesion molecule 1-like [Oratosquilla oratoria]|uniref:cell adhesion molecule 1-like n=1 Tax=Oratosquilla oratoria TaxID=337810 RepID=UPI003F758FD3